VGGKDPCATFHSVAIRVERVRVFEGRASNSTQPPHIPILNASCAVALAERCLPYGVELPHGTNLRMTYNGVTHFGSIDDGSWLVEGQRFSSPSGAACGVARTKKGGKTKLDGWGYWSAQLPDASRWETLFDLWKAAEASKKRAP
jgi:hypothetical protein